MEPISVVIPTYNRAALLRRAIGSAIEASAPVDEIIVVDDGSTDETPTIPSGFNRTIQYIRISKGGAGAARNAGVKAAAHDLIGFVDSDDEWLPTRLAQQRPLMESRRDLVFSFSDFGQLFPDGHVEHGWARHWHLDARPWDEILGREQLCSALAPLAPGTPDVRVHIGSMYERELHANYININTVMVRRSRAGGALSFGTGLPTYEEWECFARIACLGPCAYLDIETALQRAHEGPRLTDADSVESATARLSIIDRTWAADPEFMRARGDEVRATVQGIVRTITRTRLYRGQFREAKSMAARLDRMNLETALLALPLSILRGLWRAYRMVKTVRGRRN